MTLEELKKMKPKQREEWFMENALYREGYRGTRSYYIRIGTRPALFASDTMELRQKFYKFLAS